MRQVRIVNYTNDSVLADSAVVAGSFFTRLRGLLGRKRLEPGTGLVLRPCHAVHTWGMRFPIDIIHVDRQGRVLKVAEAVPPGRFSSVRGGHVVVELPAGTVGATGTITGHELQLLPLSGKGSLPAG